MKTSCVWSVLINEEDIVLKLNLDDTCICPCVHSPLATSDTGPGVIQRLVLALTLMLLGMLSCSHTRGPSSPPLHVVIAGSFSTFP